MRNYRIKVELAGYGWKTYFRGNTSKLQCKLDFIQEMTDSSMIIINIGIEEIL